MRAVAAKSGRHKSGPDLISQQGQAVEGAETAVTPSCDWSTSPFLSEVDPILLVVVSLYISCVACTAVRT